MEDKDIVKALENAEYRRDGMTLRGFYLDHEIIKQVIDLINRQKAELEKNENIIRLADKTIETANAEIENLRNSKYIFTSVDYCESDLTEALKENDMLKAEIERLKKGWKADVILTANVKAEAYKEFAERLRFEIVNKPSEFKAEQGTVDFLNGHAYRHLETLDILDNLLKELIGE